MTILENDLLNTSIEIKNIRAEIPSLKDVVFLNSGWTGPTPRVVLEAIEKSIKNQILLAPSSKDAVKSQVSELLRAKAAIADYFETESKNICLTSSTTLGINLALNAYDWTENDEIITTTNDHASVIIPLYNLKERFNVKIKLIDFNWNDPVKSFRDNLSKNTKAALFCHVFWTTGNTLPLKEIISELRNKNVISVIDGAQSAGALKINLDDLNPDFYCVPGQKWLLGPVGTGFLYVNKALFGKRPPWPSVLGYESAGDASDDGQYDLNFKWSPKKDAGLFEFGGMNNSLFHGLAAAVDFSKEKLSRFDIYKRMYSLAEYLSLRLKESKDIIVLTSNLHAGIVSWQHKKKSAHEIVNSLWTKNKILIREIPNFNFCRASTHYFNTKEEIDFLIDCLEII